MPAYFISIRKQISNPAEIAIYRDKAIAASAGHPLRQVVSYGRLHPLKGDAPDGVSVLEFPSFEDAEAWFHSPAYQEALEHLFKGGDYQMFIVEGK